MRADSTADRRVILTARALRLAAFGFLSVTLGEYLAALGLSATSIGLIFSAALAGGAIATLAASLFADRFGRRRLALAAAVLMGVAGVIFALSRSPVVFALAAVLGSISPSGSEVGPYSSIEQAILPDTVPPERRTGLFAWYNLVGSLAASIGSLGTSLVEFAGSVGLTAIEGERLFLWLYAVAAFGLAVLYSRLSPAVELRPSLVKRASFVGIHRSRGVVARLAVLFAVDSFGGGLVVQSLIVYWFVHRYGASPALIGAIFFGTNLCAGLSFLAAAWLARRIGLINTMVFTHLPSNVITALVPLMPSFPLAVGMLLLRYMLSQMDVPTRQSYMMAVVDPDERTAAAGLTTVARNVAAAIAPVFTGLAFQSAALSVPFIAAGLVKIVYDLALYRSFRNLRPPEEQQAIAKK